MIVVFVFPQPQFVACGECGQTMPRWEAGSHVCDRERWLDFQLVRLRPGLIRFDRDLSVWLSSVVGRFEVFYAARERTNNA